MKKYTKITTAILTSSLLLGASSVFLSENQNSFTQNISMSFQTSDNVQVVNSENDIVYINNHFGGSQFALVKDDVNGDRVYAWGFNGGGHLGDGTKKDISSPTLVKNFWGEKRVTHIATGDDFSLMILDNRELWATGDNGHGQFGNGKNIIFVPTLEFGKTYTFESDVKQLSTGGYSALALTTDNKVYAWGHNGFAQAGVGTTNDVLTPTTVDLGVSGTVLKIVNNTYSSMAMVDNGKNIDLLLWGNSTDGYLGVGLGSVLTPTLLTFNFPSKILDIYMFGEETPSIFVMTENDGLYAWGKPPFDSAKILGIDPTKVPMPITLPFTDKIIGIQGSYHFTALLTSAGELYTVGDEYASGHGTNTATFTKVAGLPKIDKMSCTDSSIRVWSGNESYVWGHNERCQYGNGTTAGNSLTPIPSNIFKTPSSFKQIKNVDNEYSYEAAAKIYDSKTGFNQSIFETYAEKSEFFDDTTFSMKEAPEIIGTEGKIVCTIYASKSYMWPDGALSVTDSPVKATIDGFKILPESKIENLQLSTKPKYNLNNIVNALRKEGSDEVNEDTFKELFATTNFPADNKFTIVKDSDKISDGVYVATLKASSAQFNGLPVTGHDYPVKITGLVARLDSEVKSRTPWLTELDGILAALKPSEEVSASIMNKLIDVDSQFPENTKFIINSVVYNKADPTIEINFTPDRIYKDGNDTPNATVLNAKVTFVEQPAPANNDIWIYVGLAAGGVVLLLLIVSLIVWRVKRAKREDAESEDDE